MTERVRAAPAQTSVSGKQARRMGRLRLAGVFGAAVLVGSVGTLLLTRSAEAPPPVKVVKPAPPVTVAPPLNPPPPVEEVVVEDPVVTVTTPAQVKPRPPKPKPVVVAAVPPPPPPPRVEEPRPRVIAPGIGKLRVSTVPGSAAVQVLVNGKAVGPPPQNINDVKSGPYTVELRLADGKKSPPWRGDVLPDATTVLMFDPDSGKWRER
jgi:hypothetical protein